MVLHDSLYGSLGLVIIAGVDDRHTGKHPHHADILQNLVGSPVLPERQTGVTSTYLDVLIAVGDALADLVVDAARAEVSKGGRQRDFPARSQSGSHTHHIGFRDTHLNEAIRVGIDEVLGFHGAAQVGSQHDDFVVLVAGGFESGTEAVAGSLFAGLLEFIERKHVDIFFGR